MTTKYNDTDIMVQNAARLLGGKFRISRKGVPHFILSHNDVLYSVCWMGYKQVWRVFWPYPANVQNRKSFNTIAEVQQWLS